MKVLVIRLSSMGDVVMSTAAIDLLSRAGCEVFCVTKPVFACLYRTHPGVREVYSYDKHQFSNEREAFYTFQSWLAEKKFDVVIDLHDSLRTRLWRFLWWISRRFSFRVYVARKERFREVLILLFRLGKIFGWGRGGRARKMQNLAFKVLHDASISVDQGQLATKLEANTGLAAALDLPQNYVVILPGSAWDSKRWPLEKFAELAQKISVRWPLVILGGEKERDCEIIPAVKKFFGTLSLEQSVAVIAGAKFVIGNDTGLVHVAEALHKPVVMIEGPTEAALGFTPFLESTRVVEKNLFCRPCSKNGAFCWRFGMRTCLNGISVNDVMKAVDDVAAGL